MGGPGDLPHAMRRAEVGAEVTAAQILPRGAERIEVFSHFLGVAHHKTGTVPGQFFLGQGGHRFGAHTFLTVIEKIRASKLLKIARYVGHEISTGCLIR